MKLTGKRLLSAALVLLLALGAVPSAAAVAYLPDVT